MEEMFEMTHLGETFCEKYTVILRQVHRIDHTSQPISLIPRLISNLPSPETTDNQTTHLIPIPTTQNPSTTSPITLLVLSLQRWGGNDGR